jgi:hypothetical protein
MLSLPHLGAAGAFACNLPELIFIEDTGTDFPSRAGAATPYRCSFEHDRRVAASEEGVEYFSAH